MFRLKITKNKRGQDATNAATLVAILAALIILYLMFLPPQTREELLFPNKTTNKTATATQETEANTLLKESPGRLSYLGQNEYEHTLPSFTLYRTISAKELKSENPFVARTGWFDKKTKNISFSIADFANTENIALSFVAPEHEGNLIIRLNSNTVFESAVESLNVEPINLPKELLGKSNTLEFSVSGVGWQFWKTNQYAIKNLKITADITDVSRQESRNLFTATATEKFNLEKSTLRFVPNCRENDVGILDININTYNVFSAVPDCGIANRLEVPTGIIDSGENRITFKTNKGSYLIDQISITNKLKEQPSTVYYFEISQKQFDDIQNSRQKANFTISFVESDKDKEAAITINGHSLGISQKKNEYSRIIEKSWLNSGTNYIKIEPKATLDVVSLIIRLQ
ncbi:MAG TPA: hypothetical protein VI894_00780 [Candidatus Nanoarchaeia archaeon]|nr:hypothetical protein [Candidatus Nanoarchaeia archaeon]